MPVRRIKKRDIITIGDKAKPVDNTPKSPECYGQKDSYCRKDLCGKWFESCKRQS